jgi:hypothetical protein
VRAIGRREGDTERIFNNAQKCSLYSIEMPKMQDAKSNI